MYLVSFVSPRPSSTGIRPFTGGRAQIGWILRGEMIFRFGAYEVDLVRQELRRAGAVVPVEPQVFDVLAYLLRHRDRIVSKDELFESVWQGRIVSDAALNSRISAARRTIGDDGNTQALIRTAHKRGFRFVGDVHVDDAEPPAEAKGASPEGNVSQDTPNSCSRSRTGRTAPASQ